MVATHVLNLAAPGSIPGWAFFVRLSASAVCLAVDHGIRSHTQEAKKIVTILSRPPPLATRRVSVRGYLFNQLYSSLRLVFESSDDKDFFPTLNRTPLHAHTTPTHTTLTYADNVHQAADTTATCVRLRIKRNVQRQITSHHDNAHGRAAILIPTVRVAKFDNTSPLT